MCCGGITVYTVVATSFVDLRNLESTDYRQRCFVITNFQRHLLVKVQPIALLSCVSMKRVLQLFVRLRLYKPTIQIAENVIFVNKFPIEIVLEDKFYGTPKQIIFFYFTDFDNLGADLIVY